MTIHEQLESVLYTNVLVQGTKASIKNTAQVVEVKRVSEHGISAESFRSGG